MKILQNTVIFMVAVFTVLLPLKLASIVGVPEVISLFPPEIFPWLIISWPVTLFPIVSGVLMILAISVFPLKIGQQFNAFMVSCLWLVLGLTGYLGAINASVKDFVYSQIAHGLGIGAYAITIYFILSNRPHLRRRFLILLASATLLVALLGWEQRLVGFEETRRFVMTQQQETGVAMAGDFMARVMDNRVYSTFASCNNLAGFLLMLMPLVFWYAWKLGSRIEPPYAGRVIFLLIAFLLVMMPFFMTGSRAALAVLFVTTALLLMLFPVDRRLRYAILAVSIISLTTGALAIHFAGRGFWSMFARLDYQRASIIIFAENPILGTGWGDFFHDYMVVKSYPSKEAPHDPHCMLLAYLAQCGIIGGAVCLAVLLWPLWKGWHQIRGYGGKFYDKEDFWIFAGITSGIIHSQVDTNMQVPAIMCYLAALQVSLMIKPCSCDSAKTGLPLKILFLLIAFGAGFASMQKGLHLLRAEKAFAELENLISPNNKGMQHRQVTAQQINSALENCVALKPYSPFPWQMAGDFMFARGVYETAERYYRKALELSPRRASGWYRMHRICQVTNREEEAMVYLHKARALFPLNEDYKHPWKRPNTQQSYPVINNYRRYE
ncbi:MAG: hypothetical protein GX280_07380 [Lentisphaerae bacterium]|nr:hypothetical protein [Lentisphaerota bacterium]